MVLFQQTSEGEWRVDSMSGCNANGYTVKLIHAICLDCSPFKEDMRICREPNCGFLCPHMYTCDSRCYDYTNGHMCKHIHRVHSLVHQNLPKAAPPSEPEFNCHDDQADEDNISYAESVFDPHKGTCS